MKKYIAIFLASFLIFLVIFTSIIWAVGGFEQQNIVLEPTNPSIDRADVTLPPKEKHKKIVNVLVMGLNQTLADTIFVMSVNTEEGKIDMISVPRDTYNEVDGFTDGWYRKINSVYGMERVGGAIGMKREVSNIIGMPIDYYVKVEFSGVVSVVDTLGGYDVNVPFAMDYDDPYARPRLHIHIPKGQRHLNGQETLGYLRFRQNNSRTINGGDLPRVERQQQFIKDMIKKIVTEGKIVQVIKTVLQGEYVDTDIQVEEALDLVLELGEFDPSNIHTFTLPGEAGYKNQLSYFFHDKDKVIEYVKYIYEGVPYHTGDDDTEETVLNQKSDKPENTSKSKN